jgi:hypothetical protein
MIRYGSQRERDGVLNRLIDAVKTAGRELGDEAAYQYARKLGLNGLDVAGQLEEPHNVVSLSLVR